MPESARTGCAASGSEGPEGTAPSSEGPKGAAPGSEGPEGTTGGPEGTAPGQKVKCRLLRLRIPILGRHVLPSPLEIRLLADLMEWGSGSWGYGRSGGRNCSIQNVCIFRLELSAEEMGTQRGRVEVAAFQP